MSLRDLQYQEDYRSGYDNIVEDFFHPSLQEAKSYWRAVGYFSSSALEAFGAPLSDFIKSGGSIRLVTSVELSELDLRAIEEGTNKREICEARLQSTIDEQFASGMGDGAARLCALLKMGRMEILIAVPKTGTGVYHEKIGIFSDGEAYVAFTGSSNESRNAFENNRECIDVYTSWQGDRRAERKRVHFKNLWDREDQGVDVYTFPQAAEKKLLRIYERTKKRSRQPHAVGENKWRHQEEALGHFLDAERGVLNLATGTGKTRTAMKIVSALFEAKEIDTVIFSMDGTDLLHQWHVELLALRQTLPAPVFVYRDYEVLKELQDFLLAPTHAMLLVSRRGGVARDPLASAMNRLTPGQANRTLLVHDEVHKLGSPASRKRLAGLSDQIRFRLGLSATPEREYDNEGNDFIKEHIGVELMRFELDDAIRRGILTPFDYYPLVYEPLDEDKKRVSAVYKKQAARANAGDPMSDEEVWIEIARVYKTSPAKLPVFAEFIARNTKLLERCIIFVETMEFGKDVLEIVHKYRSDFHTYFTGDESETLQRFARGDLECLVTCHRLSEGIDIKSLSSVILFSSARARLETIQRMGRCLRINPLDPSKIASIVDFIRQSENASNDRNADEERRDWIMKLSKVRPEEK